MLISVAKKSVEFDEMQGLIDKMQGKHGRQNGKNMI